jgi:hypothetical protein
MTSALIMAAAALGSTAMLCLAGLSAWRGWLDLRRYEIAAGRAGPEAREPNPGVRIEMADLKERLRKLEAIATGLDP